MCRRLIYFVILLLFSVHTRAQNEFIVRQFSTENGLPSNGIKGLQWDEATGFLWMATEAGVVRFNGVDFVSFTKENTAAIRSERMAFMIRNHAGVIYSAGESGEIITINQNKPQLWVHQEIANGGVFRLSLLTVSDSFFMQHSGITGFGAYSIIENKIAPISDTAIFALRTNELFYFSKSMGKPRRYAFGGKKIKFLFKIGNQCFVADDQNQVFLLDPFSEKTERVLVETEHGNPLNIIEKNSILSWENGMGKPVFIENNKAWLLTMESGKIMARLVIEGIPPDVLIRIAQYSEKNKALFIGTDSKGLIVITRARVQPMKRNAPNTKNRNSYYAQVELPNGNILTNEGDIIGNSNLANGVLPVKGKFGFTISRIRDSLLWYSGTLPNTRNILQRYNFATGETISYPKIKTGNNQVIAESEGKTYLADGSGIAMIEGDSLRYLIKQPANKITDIIYDMKEMGPGLFAIANCSGLLRFNAATRKTDTLLKTNKICLRTIWKYNDYLFLGSYGSGFYILKNGKVKQMPLDKNKYLLYTHCFIPDNFGFCWISTNRGLFKAQLSDLLYAFDHEVPQVYYQYFGKNDGMDITEMNGGCIPCALVLKNKTISFPTMDGLLWVNPETANPLMPEGNIFIDRFSADGKVIEPDSEKSIRLPATTGEIRLLVGFSAWCNKENILLEYRLGDDKKWQPVDVQNGAEIKFSNLPPGDYVMQIRKMNGFGVNNYSFKTVEFTIITPWHKQWWFYTLIAAAVASLVLLFLRIRTRQYKIRQIKLEQQVREKTKELQQQNEMLEKNNTIKTRLISIISHDIVTPLKFLNVAGKNLVDKKQMMSEELQRETIMEITNTSQELQLLSTNILNWIKYQNENRQLIKEILHLHELVNQVLGVLQSYAKQKKLNLVNAVDKDLTLFQYLEPLKILVYNLVTNAINFTEQGDIVISTTATTKHITVSVKDSGMGMTPEQVRNIMSEQIIVSSANIDNRKGNGLGYLIIKDLVKMTGATLQIQSKKGSGTEVFIEFPLNGQS